MPRFKKKMRDSYDISDASITITSSKSAPGYVFVEIRSYDSDEVARIGLHGKRLRKFIRTLKAAEVA